MGEEKTKITGALNSFVQNFILRGVASIIVPILFIISGYLFFCNLESGSKREFINRFKKRFKTLVVPYFFWSLFGLLLFFALQSFNFSKPFFTRDLVRDFSVNKWMYTIFYLPIPAQLWFIRDLIVLILFTPLLYKLLRVMPVIILLACFTIWFFNVRIYLFSPESLFFFTIGCYWGIKKFQIQNLYKVKFSMFLLTLWITLEVIKTLLVENHIYINWLILLLHKTAIIAGVIALWDGYDFIYKNEDISKKKYYWLFEYSVWIYLAHQPLLNIIKKGLYYLVGINAWSSPVIYVIAPVVTLIIVIPAGMFFKKYLPKTYSLSTGGR